MGDCPRPHSPHRETIKKVNLEDVNTFAELYGPDVRDGMLVVCEMQKQVAVLCTATITGASNGKKVAQSGRIGKRNPGVQNGQF